MDSITQIVLGAAVGEAVGGKELGGKAALWGAIAGTIPDLDVILNAFNDPIKSAYLHRGFSHSIVFALLAGPSLGWIIYQIYKKRYSLKLWIGLFFLAIITHPMLDIFTNYGTQFFWPLDWRVTFNSAFVIDPLYTLPFAILLITALFLKRENKWRRRLNYSGIVLSTLYLLWGLTVKMIILNKAPSYFSAYAIKEDRTVVTPMPFTSFYWMLITEDETSYYVGYKSLFYPFNKNEIDTLRKNHDQFDRLQWKHADEGEMIRLMTNDRFSVVRLGDSVEVYDLKFGLTSQFTDPRISEPVRGYGMVIDSNIVNKTYIVRPKQGWENINFEGYFSKIFNNDKNGNNSNRIDP